MRKKKTPKQTPSNDTALSEAQSRADTAEHMVFMILYALKNMRPYKRRPGLKLIYPKSMYDEFFSHGGIDKFPYETTVDHAKFREIWNVIQQEQLSMVRTPLNEYEKRELTALKEIGAYNRRLLNLEDRYRVLSKGT